MDCLYIFIYVLLGILPVLMLVAMNRYNKTKGKEILSDTRSIFQGEVFFSIPFILLIIYRYTYNQIIGFMFPAILSICIVTSIKFFLNKHKLKVIAIGVIVFLIFAFLCNSFIHDTQMVHVYCCMVLALLCWGLDILVRKMP